MKLKLFFAAFAAVALMASCAERSDVPGEGPNGLINGKTVATFTLNIDNPATKAYGDFNPLGVVEGSTAEKSIDPASIRLLIIDVASGIIDFNDLFSVIPPVDGVTTTTATRTVQVTAGEKKIYVIANLPTAQNTILASLVKDVNTLNDFNAVAKQFNAGAPQFPWSNKTLARSFIITDLTTVTAPRGLPASTTDKLTYVLKAGVSAKRSAENSTAPLSPVVSGNTVSQNNNNFNLDLVFMMAKAQLYHNSSAGTVVKDAVTIGNVSDIKYAIHNLARITTFVQHVAGTYPQSWYYGKAFATPMLTGSASYTDGLTGTPAAYLYGGHFDAGVNVSQPSISIAGMPSGSNTNPWLYVPENNNTGGLTWGQASFFAINANYRPTKIVTAVTYEPTADPKLVLTIPSPAPTTAYVYLLKTIAGSGGVIEAGTCFETEALLKQAAWLCGYATNVIGGGWSSGHLTDATQSALILALTGTCPTSTVPAQLPEDPAPNYGYYKFDVPVTSPQIAGGSWYKVAIGDPRTGSDPYYKYGVFRGKAYQAVIASFNGPGVPYEWMLVPDPGEPVDATTALTVNIQILDWEYVPYIVDVP